jgi:hypothetical protein
LAIRQTILQDSNGLPVLENFALESGGKVIDENGTWMIDVPMNLDYYTTNEFGEQVLSNDPEVGIPTKGKYRFKIKWAQSPSLSETTRRGYFLVPNIKEYPSPNLDESYAFSTDWNDYAYTGTTAGNPDNILSKKIIKDAIDCEDKFYLMQYNKVYTVSQFISGRRQGSGIERYIGIKNILDETCSGLNNRFPTNDGNFRFDILYIIFMFFSIILTPVFFALILVMHILYFVVWILRTILLPLLAAYYAVIGVLTCAGAFSYGFGAVFSIGVFLSGLAYIALAALIVLIIIQLFKINLSGIKVPILTYPECDLCPCDPKSSTNENIGEATGSPSSSVGNKVDSCVSILSNTNITSIDLTPGMLPLFSPSSFNIPTRGPATPNGYEAVISQAFNQNLTGVIYDNQYASNNIGAPCVIQFTYPTDTGNPRFCYTTNLPISDKINLFNVKAKYFNPSTNNPGGGVNRISVNFNPQQSVNKHFDNTTVILCDKASIQNLTPGQLISFQNPTLSKDINLTGGVLNKYGNNAITGITSTGVTNIKVYYANPDGTSGSNLQATYSVNITADTSNNFHKFPTDVEYFQVITAMTYNQFSGQCSNQLGNDSLNRRYINNPTLMAIDETEGGVSNRLDEAENQIINSLDYLEDAQNMCVLILNRGVDPYTPKVLISYGLGRLFGRTLESDKTVTGFYHMNIPIQGKFLNVSHLSSNLSNSNISTDTYSGQKLYFNSFSYRPQIVPIIGQITGYTAGQPVVTTGTIVSEYSGFSSNLISYYSYMDKTVMGWKANCGGNINNVTTITTNVANTGPTTGVQTGLRVSPQNRFSQRVYTVYIRTFFGYANINYINTANPYTTNTGNNQGYFPNEIVEGGPIMYSNLQLYNAYDETTGGGNVDVVYNVTGNGPYSISSNYFTRIYNTTGNTINFTLGNLNPSINLKGGYETVMRGDRLPTSTNVEEYCCNGMVLQKNSNFKIFLIPEDGVLEISSSQSSTGSAGSGDLDYNYQDLQGSTGITRVFESFTCEGSVNLECYDCQNSTILIRPRGNPCQEYLGETIFEFGCYRFITTIFLSLGRDWELMFEWVARNMVMLGACRNVFSHRFINNWVNGVLYAFPFKNEIVGYTSPTHPTPNQPIPNFCGDTLRYYGQTKNFYYRATPYNPTTKQFREISSGNMGFPTTIMDLGPRANYLQELVMSDEYDGYVANRLDSSSFGTVDDILNLFIVSRFMDNDFLTNLLGSLNILAYFSNSRPNRGAGGTNLMIDADYAQLISINSELGVAPFLSSNYPDNPPGQQNPIFFDCSNVLGIFFSSDTQLRDYITPKRTIINPSGTSVGNCTFNNFPVYSQVVPLSQWKIETNPTSYSGNDSIFGRQFNNWDFKVSGNTIFSNRYQSLDRLLQSSRYFRTDGSVQTQYQKGYIYAVKTVNNGIQLSASPDEWDFNNPSPQLVTVGAPFHFYFGLRRGSSAFDRFRQKWINTSNIVN